jgi:hypothetical protein
MEHESEVEDAGPGCDPYTIEFVRERLAPSDKLYVDIISQSGATSGYDFFFSTDESVPALTVQSRSSRNQTIIFARIRSPQSHAILGRSF